MRVPGPQEGARRILVHGSELMSCEGIAALLRGVDGVEVVGTNTEIADLARYVRGRQPDVVLVVSWPEDPAELAQEVLESLGDAAHGANVLVLGRETDADTVRRTLRSGARGYVLAMEGTDVLAEAVALASKGYAYVSPRMGCEIARIPEPQTSVLTEREQEVVELLAHGHTNAEVARQLFLSVRTIESHRRAIYEKCSFAARHELVAYASAVGLFPSSPGSLRQAKKNATATIA